MSSNRGGFLQTPSHPIRDLPLGTRAQSHIPVFGELEPPQTPHWSITFEFFEQTPSQPTEAPHVLLQPISATAQHSKLRSYCGGRSGFGYNLPSHPLQFRVSLKPPQIPQMSLVLTPYGVPEQSRQVLLPSHTPQRSYMALPPTTPLQSTHEQSLPPHTPHWSSFLPLLCLLPFW